MKVEYSDFAGYRVRLLADTEVVADTDDGDEQFNALPSCQDIADILSAHFESFYKIVVGDDGFADEGTAVGKL